MKRTFCALALALVSGCAGPGVEKFHAICTEMGYEPQTPAHVKCTQDQYNAFYNRRALILAAGPAR
jgi:hypothetical protein